MVVQPPPNPDEARDAAVRRIVEQDGMFLLRLLSRACVQPASAEDLLQDMLIVLTRFIDDFGVPPMKERAYLVRVAGRLLDNRRRRFHLRVDPEAEADASADSAPDPEALLQMVRERVALAAAIEALPAHLQPVVRYCELDELTLDQAAAKLGRPRATVHDWLTKGRALIGQILDKDGKGR